MEFKARRAYLDAKVVSEYEGKRFSSLKGKLVNHVEKELIMRAIKFISLPKGAMILDLPCGTGRISMLLAKKGYKVTGGDISSQMVEKSSSEAIKMRVSNRANFRVIDAEKIDFPDNYFDTVLSLRFFGHTPPQVRIKILKEFKRVSKRFLILAYYRKNSLQQIIRGRRRRSSGIPWYPVLTADINREFNQVGIKSLKSFSILRFVSETIIVVGEKA